jgi:hypothetical protein
MSLFDNVRSKEAPSELKLMVLLKYGSPYPNFNEFLDSIPSVVVREAYKDLAQSYYDYNFQKIRETLTIMLENPADRDRAAKVLMNRLFEYHMLTPI